MTHVRKKPKKNSFNLKLYHLFIDLDELEELDKKIKIFSYNKRNILSFYDEDHFKFLKHKGILRKISKEKIPYNEGKYKGTTKDKIKTMIKELKLDFVLGKVFMFTNLRNLGYIFNPVSFYYCYDNKGKLRVLFSEVNNTFHQQKMYYVVVNPNKKIHKDKQRKNYYISPFIDYDTDLSWNFTEPNETFFMAINSIKEDKAQLKTSLNGKRMNEPEKQQLFCDRTKAGKTDFSVDFPARIIANHTIRDGVLQLSIFIDVASAEMFADNGKTVMTNIFFPNEDFNQLKVYSKNGSVKLKEGAFYAFDTIY